jgi:hypothetical protein
LKVIDVNWNMCASSKTFCSRVGSLISLFLLIKQQRAIDRKRRTCGEDVESVGKERDGAEKQPEDSESKSEETTEMQERKCSRWGMMERRRALATSTVPSTSLFLRAETLGRIWASPPIISSYGKLQLIELISVPPCPVHCVIAGDPMSELRLRGSAAVPGTNARREVL